jgi:sugar phosphate isomerase/epimerase
MRFRHPDGSVVHLAYCTNVHPAEDVEGILSQLRLFAGQVRRQLDVPRLGIGLWISADAAAGLVRDAETLARLRGELEQWRLEVVTLNGFPYSSFHAPVVKRRVYRPDWTDPARLAYTLDLARLLAALLPEDAEEGTISTLPLGWRSPWGDGELARARAQLSRLAGSLAELEEETGRRIRIGLEPEPGCVVETTEQAGALLFDLEPERIGVCLDACHLAVQFEEPAAAVASLRAAGVPIVKAQVSSALRVSSPRSRASAERLAAFAEPRFLHQTRERRGGVVTGVDDLGDAMAGGLPGDGEWRVHFHVPVHANGGETTQPELAATLEALLGSEAPLTRHLEIETYTWTVLPEERRPGHDGALVAALAREVEWTRERLLELGLEEVSS